MKIIVAIKRVVDHAVRVTVRGDGTGVETANVKMSMNPFDEIALEQAIRLKEAGTASEVVVVSIGPDNGSDVLRTGLAMGADRAMLITAPGRVEPLAVAKLLARVVEEEQPGLVLVGKQAIDDDAGQTGQMLAALLGWPQATCASALTIADGRAEVARDVDGGSEVVSVQLPAVIAADLRLCTPRYASLPNIMRAKSKPLAVRPVAEFGIDVTPQLKVLTTVAPADRAPCVMVGSVDELVSRLKSEAGIV